MISSGGSAGVSGLLAGEGVGNFVESGGCIGPAPCARGATGAAATSMARAQSADKKFDLINMEAVFIVEMQFPGIMLPAQEVVYRDKSQ
jgi:hypothetical protein